jgi:hypothetical protein
MTESSDESVVTFLFITFSILGFLSSLVILFLIKLMNKWNGYLALIWSVEICQLFYDASFALYNIKYRRIHALWTGIQFFGGLSSSVWTNILSFVVLYVVFKMSSFDILGHYYYFCFLALAPAFTIFILHMCYVGDDKAEINISNAYYYLRFLSIVFNFVTFGVIWYRARLIKSKSPSNKSPVEIAINVLSLRMIYYPFMQAVTVLPAAIYEWMYGIHQADPNSRAQFAFDCLFAVLTPSTGIGYLAIFLVMQPNAYKHFWAILTTGARYRPADCSGVANSSSTQSARSRNPTTLISSTSVVPDTNQTKHGMVVPLNRDELHERMVLMEDEELLSEIDSAHGGSSGYDSNRDSEGSGSARRFGSPFWSRSENLSYDL